MHITNYINTTKLNQEQSFKHEPYHLPNFIFSDAEDETIDKPEEKSDISVFSSINRGRVAIFLDGSNLFYAALQLGIEVDYTKLLCLLTQKSQLLRAFFYTGVDRTNEKQQGFLLWMRRNGYRVITKDLIQLADGSKKANLDVEIAVDMMTLADHYDTAVLISGDGDLAYAANAVSFKGVRVEVVSLRSMTSDSLINVADCYIDLDAIKHHIQKGA
ncbi:MAG: NYN domain-containing protein [Calothrix sp. C42_A2020_038]|nr:NYN domain-containing protein [Calothrix sp. C42_A2020_038]